MSSVWNNKISVSLFGEAQSPLVGVTVNNLPSGEYIDISKIKKFMARLENSNLYETLTPHIISGLFNSRTTGTPLCAFIQNLQQYTSSAKNNHLARAGHADYTGAVRYRGFNDVRDGGHFSDRLTLPLSFAGAICGQILERRGIYTGVHISRIHNVKDNPFNPVKISREDIINIRNKNIPVINDLKGSMMIKEIDDISNTGDSLGGVIECVIINVPAGIGSPVFDGLQNTISQLIFALPLVTGIEFGTGFKSAEMTGSKWNDDFYIDSHNHVLTKTNNHGGILGGISSGMPIIFKVAFRPNPSLSKPNKAIDLQEMTTADYQTSQNYTPCTVLKAIPAVEAIANIAILTHMLDYPNFC